MYAHARGIPAILVTQNRNGEILLHLVLDLYRLILSKRLEVVGDQKLRTQIAAAAAANPSKPVVVDGFVYDRMTPYLVLVSVGDAP